MACWLKASKFYFWEATIYESHILVAQLVIEFSNWHWQNKKIMMNSPMTSLIHINDFNQDIAWAF